MKRPNNLKKKRKQQISKIKKKIKIDEKIKNEFYELGQR
jgi:hypothetical protein